MARSWLDNEKTRRTYRVTDSLQCVVQNEYQTVRCPHCEKQQYCRLTHFWFIRHIPTDSQMICHTNYDDNLDRLRELTVQYVDGAALTERMVEGRWALLKNGDVWAEEES